MATTSYLGDGALVAIDGGPGYSLADRRFFHADLIGSTRLLTDGTGAVSQSLAYTAFSEPLGAFPASTPRYGYAGAWGYQSDATDAAGNPLIGDSTFPFSLAHVGARYYAPSLGRFTMRDPIRIFGGLNVYSYVYNAPSGLTDPDGRFTFSELVYCIKERSKLIVVTAGLVATGYALYQALMALMEMAEQGAAEWELDEYGFPAGDQDPRAPGVNEALKHACDAGQHMPGTGVRGPGRVKPGRP